MNVEMTLGLVILGLGCISFLVALAYKRNPLVWLFWGSALPGLGLLVLLVLIALEKRLSRNCCSYVERCLRRSSCDCVFHEDLKDEEIRALFKAHVSGRKACFSGLPQNPYRNHPSSCLRQAWEDGWNEAKRFIEFGRLRPHP